MNGIASGKPEPDIVQKPLCSITARHPAPESRLRARAQGRRRERGPWLRAAAARSPRAASLLAALIGAVLGLAVSVTPAAAADFSTLEIASKSGVHVFQVEMAVTDEERERGLMFRRVLPEGQGMLFDFRRDQTVSMWMKNTYIPLDMLFIQADGRISRIAENTEPLSTRIISSGGPVRAVLEVIGGTARRFGIAVGDQVAHPIFSGR